MLSLALGLACARLPAVQLPAREAGGRVHGRLRQPGARLHARRARAGDELEGGGDDRRDARSCRSSCSACRSSTPALVTIVRLVEGRPIHQGGRTTPRTGSSAAGCPSTGRRPARGDRRRRSARRASRYSVLGDYRITLVGVLSPSRCSSSSPASSPTSSAATRRGRRAAAAGCCARSSCTGAGCSRCCVDFALISASFSAAYVLLVGGTGTAYERHVFDRRAAGDPRRALPRVHPSSASTRGVWRYAGSREAAAIVVGVAVSEAVAFGIVAATTTSATSRATVFVVDALLCTVADRRLAVRRAGALPRAHDARGPRRPPHADRRRRPRRAGASLRELRETPGEQVVGFVDDDPRLHRRRLLGVRVARRHRATSSGSSPRPSPTPCS